MSKVTIHCTHPHGLELTANGVTVQIGGTMALDPIYRRAKRAATHGVDAGFWNRWLEEHKDSPLVLNRVVYALPEPEPSPVETAAADLAEALASVDQVENEAATATTEPSEA